MVYEAVVKKTATDRTTDTVEMPTTRLAVVNQLTLIGM